MTTKLYNLFEAPKMLLLHLWWSVSSVDFYRTVYKSYKGYGIKYLFTISFISSVIFCAFLLPVMVDIEDYLSDNRTSEETALLDYVFQQLPEISYDGKSISITEETPFYLQDKAGRKILAIDPKNQLNYVERRKIPIVLGASDVLISLSSAVNNNSKNVGSHEVKTLPYKTLFGQENKVFTPESLKLAFKEKMGNFINIFIFVGMPILIVWRFTSELLEKVLIIVLIYVVTNATKLGTSAKTAIRMVMFSSGAAILLQPLIILTIPTWSNLVWLIQMWSNLLMILAILKVRNNAIQV